MLNVLSLFDALHSVDQRGFVEEVVESDLDCGVGAVFHYAHVGAWFGHGEGADQAHHEVLRVAPLPLIDAVGAVHHNSQIDPDALVAS